MAAAVCAVCGPVEDAAAHLGCARGGNGYHPGAEYAAGFAACRAEVVRRLVAAWGPPSPTSDRALDAGFAQLIQEIESLDVDAELGGCR